MIREFIQRPGSCDDKEWRGLTFQPTHYLVLSCNILQFMEYQLFNCDLHFGEGLARVF